MQIKLGCTRRNPAHTKKKLKTLDFSSGASFLRSLQGGADLQSGMDQYFQEIKGRSSNTTFDYFSTRFSIRNGTLFDAEHF